MHYVKKSNYLRNREFIFLALAFGLIALAIIVSLIMRAAQKSTAGLSLGGLIFLILVYGMFLRLSGYFERRGDRYGRGRFGEKEVLRELRLLDDRFTVFQNLRLGNRGDNDFVVIGPTGVFAIEVKRYYRVNSFDFQRFLFQTRKEAVTLGKYLQQTLNRKIWVTPILTLVDLKQFVPFGEQSGVHVVTPNALLRIAAGSGAAPVLDSQTVQKIAQVLIQAR